MYLRRPAADENAVAHPLPFKVGLSSQNSTGPAKPMLSKLPGKLQSSSGVQGHEKPRKALGDLTNSQKTGSVVPSKKVVPAKPPSLQMPEEPPIEKMAGKGWRAMQEELAMQEEAELKQRLERIAQSAHSWSNNYLWDQDDEGSVSDSDSDVSCDNERFPEVPIVVQLVPPAHAEGGILDLRGCKNMLELLPEMPEVSLDLDFCWSSDDETV